jgi:hypothetical protein
MSADIDFVDLGEQLLKGLERPERLYRIRVTNATDERNEAAGRSAFVGREHELAARLRARFRSPERLRRRLTAFTTRERGLAELGWRARAQRAGVPVTASSELAALGGDLFAAARSVADTDRYLNRVDRRALARQLSENRELAVLSHAAARTSESQARQLGEIDALAAARANVPAVADDVEAGLRDPTRTPALRAQVRRLTTELDTALAAAQGDLGPHGTRLRRTLTRGVYRLGPLYAVPYYDDLGIAQRRDFELRSDAQAFRSAVRLREQAALRHAQQPFAGAAPNEVGHADTGGGSSP